MAEHASKKIHKSYTGIETVEIINSKEKVEFKTGKGKAVRLEGVVADSDAGVSISMDTKILYLVRFHGTLTLPPQIELKVKQGVDDVRQELYATYAPLIPYSELIEHEESVARSARYKEVPAAEVITELQKIYGPTGLPLFATPSQLRTPAALRTVDWDILLDRYDRQHSFKKFTQDLRQGKSPLARLDIAGSEKRDVRSIVDQIVYDAARQTAMPGRPAAHLRQHTLKIATHADYRQLRELRNSLLSSGQWVENKLAEGRKAQNRLTGDLTRAIDLLDRHRVGFGAGLLRDLRPLSRPISGRVLVNHLAASVRAATDRKAGDAKRREVINAVATIGVATGSTRYAQDMHNIRRLMKVYSVVTFATAQASLDHRFAERPDQPIAADEYNAAVGRAGRGAQAARTEFERKRTEDRQSIMVLEDELGTAPPGELTPLLMAEVEGATGNVTTSNKIQEDVNEMGKNTITQGAKDVAKVILIPAMIYLALKVLTIVDP